MKTIYQRLKEYECSDYYGFHMPGHKRNTHIIKAGLPYGIDITEIDGFDDLHHADGIIQKAEERAAGLYHAEETHFLVNGSTSGILSAVLGCTSRQGKILMSRNCHKSVYHAVFLNGLTPVYVYPEFSDELQLNGEIKAEDIKQILEREPQIEAVMIVSPSYDGVVSDVSKIAETVHEKGIPLIVDEAHGAHFGMHPYFPANSNQRGADVVIHSTHKTLPALTQTALIHMNGNIADRERIKNYLQMVQSSSPSYILMSSIDECMELLDQGREGVFQNYVEILEEMRQKLKRLKHLELLETKHFDRSKLVISTQNTQLTGRQLYDILRENYHIQLEMAAGTYALGMTSPGDTKEGMARFCEALYNIDEELTEINDRMYQGELPKAELAYTSAQVDSILRKYPAQKQVIPWDAAIGKIAAEYAYLYPPGCPLIVPGERVTEEIIKCLSWYEKLGFQIEGLSVEKEIGVWING